MREIPPIKTLIFPTLLLVAIFFYQFTAQSEIKLASFEGKALGTTYSVQVAYHQKNQKAPDQKGIEKAIDLVNQSMSTYLKDSELSKLNQAPIDQAIKISLELEYVLKASLELYLQSQGVFDMTIGPLVNLWGFGPDHRTTLPSKDEILALLPNIGSQWIGIQDNTLIKKKAVYCDLSAIAKGYAVDQVGRYLSAQGYTQFWVEIGGEVLVKGEHPDHRPWKAGVEHPGENEKFIYRIIPLKDISLATSGDYRNFVMDGDIRRSHTIDPRTGYPITHELASVSVLHPENMWADGWATALNVLGPEEGMKLANKMNLPVMMIVRKAGQSYETIESNAFSDYLKQFPNF
jgi:thiamine biosynthesis lipoprotein